MILSLRSRLVTASLACTLASLTVAAAQAQQTARPSQTPAKPAAAAKPPAAAKPAAPAAKPGPAAAAKPAPSAKPAAAAPAAGAARPAAAAKPAPTQSQPARSASPVADATLIETLGDWAVYMAQSGRSKICYALSQPDQRLPAGLNRDPAYLFVSMRPAENVRNEVALIFGFTANEKGPAEAAIGTASFALLPKGQAAWLRNPAEEAQLVAAMARGRNLVVKAQSARGNTLTDRYSLTGFGQAVERARRECS